MKQDVNDEAILVILTKYIPRDFDVIFPMLSFEFTKKAQLRK